MNFREYRTGVSRGLPVGMGYFSVSFGFGAMAVSQGLTAWHATLISLTNLTSAGQFAGLTVIVAAATLWEMILTQLIINSRYALMSLALSQRMCLPFLSLIKTGVHFPAVGKMLSILSNLGKSLLNSYEV